MLYQITAFPNWILLENEFTLWEAMWDSCAYFGFKFVGKAGRA